MKAWFKQYLLLDKNIYNNSHRKEITSKFILLITFPFLFVLMLGNFFYSNSDIIYVNLSIIILMLAVIYIPGRQQKYNAHIVLHFMAIGILAVVYFNHAQEYTPLWSFLYMYLVMSLYGHKIGLTISLVYLTALIALLFYFTATTVSMMEFVRFCMVSSLILFLTYFGEMLINRSVEKLITAKSMLEDLSRTDALTDLFNRRYFDEALPNQLLSANRNGEVLALVIIDIDNFKEYNDAFGHPAGDLVLIELSKLLKVQMKRGHDEVFRLGGEEFAIVYRAQDELSAFTLIEDIRVAVESLHQYCNIEKAITISAGLLLIHSDQELSIDQAYEQADKLLYQAKQSGRNRVVMSAHRDDKESLSNDDDTAGDDKLTELAS